MKRKRRKRKSAKKTQEFPAGKRGKPIIGITCEVVKKKPYFADFDLYCDYRYIRAIIRSGGIPVLLPIDPFPRDAAKLLAAIDGLLVSGGADIHPNFYGEKSKRKINPIYRGRTYFEMRLYRAAQKKKIPVLAICYGMQLLNVMYGGTLHQDIPSEVKGAISHRSNRNPIHKVEVQPGSLCYKIFKKKSFHVHSSHHQAVKVPGRSLRIVAFSEDGIPEAIEGPPRTIGVQWHPERLPKDLIQTRLFRYFIRLAKQSRFRHEPES